MPGGRSSKLDDLILIEGQPRKRWEVIVERVRAGSYAEVAAVSTGVGVTTYYRWREWGVDRFEDGKRIPARPEYREFREALDRAEAEAEQEAIAHVRSAMSTDWRAAITYLERRTPQRWRKRETVYGAGPADDDPSLPARRVRVEVDEGAPGKLAELLELLTRAESGDAPAG
jgi:hypothetical protein